MPVAIYDVIIRANINEELGEIRRTSATQFFKMRVVMIERIAYYRKTIQTPSHYKNVLVEKLHIQKTTNV